jgi:hypothetical protein
MNSQNLILLGMGLFVALIVGVVSVDQYLLDEHNPMEPAGLLWRVQTAFSRVKDLEAVIQATQSEQTESTVTMRVWYLSTPQPTLRVRYLDPPSLEGEIYTVDRDLLTHYMPEDNLTVIKRWVGFPLSQLGLGSLNVSALESEWRSGKVTLRVSQNSPQFESFSFPDALCVEQTISGRREAEPFSLCMQGTPPAGAIAITASISGVDHDTSVNAIPGGFILKVYDAATGRLTRMLWIDRETFLVKQIVLFSPDGKRTTSLYTSQLILNQGLSAQELLLLPRGTEVIRG